MPIIMMTDIQNVKRWLEEISGIAARARENQKFTEDDHKNIEDKIKKIKGVFGNLRI